MTLSSLGLAHRFTHHSLSKSSNSSAAFHISRSLHLFSRSTSSRASTNKPVVELEYDLLTPPDGNSTDKPLVILHGLFGSKRNWLSLSKAFSRDLKRPIYTLDLRNHGSSPHALPMTYTTMAEDVIHFCNTRFLTNISLLGHSMGGKVAMTAALSQRIPISRLIIDDVAPNNGFLSPEFKSYIEGMIEIRDSEVSTRKEAQDILSKYEKDPGIRAFLLTNFVPASPVHGHSHDHTQTPGHFRIPLDILSDAIPTIGKFPYEPGEKTFDGRCLFIKGSKSRYINRHNIPIAKEFFPNMVLEELDTDHWVHAEKPNEFKKLVVDFITA